MGVGGNVGGAEPLGGVDGGEGTVVVGGSVGDELLLGLLAEVAGIDEEEDALQAGVFEQAVGGGDGGEGLAGTRGHLDEGAELGLGEGVIKVGDGPDLAVAQSGGIEGGHVVLEATAERWTNSEPFAEAFRTVEGEDLAGAGLGVALVGEAGDDARGLIEEGEGYAGFLDPLKLGGGVIDRLFFDSGDILAEVFFFSLNDTDGLSIDEEDIVGRASISLIFADGLALAGSKIDFSLVLNGPARCAEHLIDGLASFLFRGEVGHKRTGYQFQESTKLGKEAEGQ